MNVYPKINPTKLARPAKNIRCFNIEYDLKSVA